MGLRSGLWQIVSGKMSFDYDKKEEMPGEIGSESGYICIHNEV